MARARGGEAGSTEKGKEPEEGCGPKQERTLVPANHTRVPMRQFVLQQLVDSSCKKLKAASGVDDVTRIKESSECQPRYV